MEEIGEIVPPNVKARGDVFIITLFLHAAYCYMTFSCRTPPVISYNIRIILLLYYTTLEHTLSPTPTEQDLLMTTHTKTNHIMPGILYSSCRILWNELLMGCMT